MVIRTVLNYFLSKEIEREEVEAAKRTEAANDPEHRAHRAKGDLRILVTTRGGVLLEEGRTFRAKLRISEQGDDIQALLLPLFTLVSGREILGSPGAGSCITA